MEKLAIGVDVGTTQAKAVAFQANGTVVDSSYVRYPLIQETEGMAEQDPETLFQAVVNCIRSEESTNWAHFFCFSDAWLNCHGCARTPIDPSDYLG